MAPTRRARPRRRPPLAALGAAALLAACGARSELIGPQGVLADAARADATTRVDAAADVPAAVDTAPECRGDVDCDDRIACTQDRCNTAAGRCEHAPDDRSCSDRRFCNGVERCDPSAGCVAGEPVRCDDGVACTLDRCNEATRRCAVEPDETLCPLSHGCDPMEGCVARALAHGPSGLFEIRLPSGLVSRIAPLPPNLTDIALAPDRTLYTIGRNVLYRVDPRTGESTVVTRMVADFTALDASPEGRLYAGAGDRIYEIDAATGASTPVATYPPGLEASGDLAFLQGRLLSTARSSPTSEDTLVEHFLVDGTTRVIGPIGVGCVWGLAAFGPTLYGMTCNSEVLRIDVATGRAFVLNRALERFYGATAR